MRIDENTETRFVLKDTQAPMRVALTLVTLVSGYLTLRGFLTLHEAMVWIGAAAGSVAMTLLITVVERVTLTLDRTAGRVTLERRARRRRTSEYDLDAVAAIDRMPHDEGDGAVYRLALRFCDGRAPDLISHHFYRARIAEEASHAAQLWLGRYGAAPARNAAEIAVQPAPLDTQPHPA